MSCVKTQDLGYSELLETLGRTAAVRQGLLKAFFEPTDDERDQGIKVPSTAHRAIAQLVKRGYVKVIVTTNFDRLMEHALEELGVPPQVISSPEAASAMQPLAHARATVIKIHGDYQDLAARNTVEELSDYPTEWQTLLRQVFDDYGLVISGWSGEWDTALVKAVEASPNRRFPLYWDRRSSKGSAAQQILANRAGQVIDSTSADEMFTDLVASLDALERLSTPPLTTEMAVARLKQYLPDPVRRIDLHDLVMGAADELVTKIAQQPVYIPDLTFEQMPGIWQEHLNDASTLAKLVLVGVWHDPSGTHDQLWIDALTRVVNAARDTATTTQDSLTNARLWPALLLFASAGIAATHRARDSLLVNMATTVQRGRRGARTTAVELLRPDYLIPHQVVPKPNGGWRYPASHHLKTAIRSLFSDLLPSDDEYKRAFHGWEFRFGLLLSRSSGPHGPVHLYGGEYLLRFERAEGEPTETEVEFLRFAASDPLSTWKRYLDTMDLDAYLGQHRMNLRSSISPWF